MRHREGLEWILDADTSSSLRLTSDRLSASHEEKSYGRRKTVRRLPPLKALPAFELAAESLSISAAAQELHLTHGAVSRQIKALEDHLGAPLFRRFNRRIELTAAGAAFLPHVRQALQVLQTSAAEVAARTRQGPLVVSLPRHLHDALADPAALCLQRRQPRDRGAAFRVPCPARFRRRRHRRRNPAGQAAVAERRRWASIPCRPRRPGRGPCPAPGSTHQATRRPQRLGLLHAETRPGAWAQWLAMMGAEDFDATKGARFEHMYFLMEAAASGLGVAIGSYPLVEQDLESGGSSLPLASCRAAAPIASCARGSDRMSPRVRPSWPGYRRRRRPILHEVK